MRIATIEEVRDMLSSLYQPPSIDLRQGGQTLQITPQNADPIQIPRAVAVPARSALHNLR